MVLVLRTPLLIAGLLAGSLLTSARAQDRLTPDQTKTQFLQREDSLRRQIGYFVGKNSKNGRKTHILGYSVVRNKPTLVYDEYIKTFKSGQSLSRRYYLTPSVTQYALGPISNGLIIKRINDRILYAANVVGERVVLALFNETAVAGPGAVPRPK